MNGEVINKNTTITTLEIANMLEMKHYKILEKLEGTKDGKTKGVIETLTHHDFVVSDYFIPSTYKDDSGKENKCYKLTRMGCEFLANKFTGEKGIVFTALYVKRFHDMEQALKKSQQAIPEKESLERYGIVEKPESGKWFNKNNWKLKIICDRFKWTRKFLYHKILVELSDLHNLELVEKLYTVAYGHKPEYKLNLLDYSEELAETATRYVNYLLIEE